MQIRHRRKSFNQLTSWDVETQQTNLKSNTDLRKKSNIKLIYITV